MMRPRSLTQPSRSSRVFHTRPEPAAGPQYPGDLLDGALGVEPVPGLRDQHGVDAVVGQRNLLGGAEQRRGVGQRIAEHLEHLRDRVDGDHVEAAFDQPRRQLAGARAEVEHVARARRQQPVDRLRRIGRSAALVGRGLRAERQRTLLVGRVGHRSRQLQCLPDQLADRLGLHQEAVVAVDRVDHVQPRTARQQFGQFLLQPQRVQPVGGDAADDHRHRAAAQRGLPRRRGRGRRRGWSARRSAPT